MNIKILQLIKGAREAEGLTVIIDVFRAFSVTCYVYQNGASDIIPVGSIEDAYKLKQENPDYILMGERKNKIQPGFDFGNSPAHIGNADFTGKTIIHTTSAGTQGIANAVHADEIVTGSLVNARAVAKYIKFRNPASVSLVCMGYEAVEPSDEDTFCAEYIKSILLDTPYDIKSAIGKLKQGSGKRFFDPANNAWSPERDFYLCVDADKFEFILKAEKDASGLVHLKKQ